MLINKDISSWLLASNCNAYNTFSDEYSYPYPRRIYVVESTDDLYYRTYERIKMLGNKADLNFMDVSNIEIFDWGYDETHPLKDGIDPLISEYGVIKTHE